MKPPRRITLEGWDVEFCNNFQLGGKVTLEIRGATNNGKGQEHIIRLKVCELSLAQFARDLRAKLLQLKSERIRVSDANLDVFKDVTP